MDKTHTHLFSGVHLRLTLPSRITPPQFRRFLCKSSFSRIM